MIDKNSEVKVTNRDNGVVGYTIPDMGNLHRRFAPGETKNITYEELSKLSWIPGGQYILKNLLKIESVDVVNELVGEVEPEYNYGIDEVKFLLSPKGSIEQLQDALQYGPRGVIELIKSIAVETELNDVAKRRAILVSTGFDVSKAIEINNSSKEKTEQKTSSTNGGRRAAPVAGTKKKPIVLL